MCKKMLFVSMGVVAIGLIFTSGCCRRIPTTSPPEIISVPQKPQDVLTSLYVTVTTKKGDQKLYAIEGAKVVIDNSPVIINENDAGGEIGTTNGDGRVRFIDIPKTINKVRVTVFAEGYEWWQKVVPLNMGEKNELLVEMTKEGKATMNLRGVWNDFSNR